MVKHHQPQGDQGGNRTAGRLSVNDNWWVGGGSGHRQLKMQTIQIAFTINLMLAPGVDGLGASREGP